MNGDCMVSGKNIILMYTSFVQQIVLRKTMRKEKYCKRYLTRDDGESVQILRVYDMQGIDIDSDPMLASTSVPCTVSQTIPK